MTRDYVAIYRRWRFDGVQMKQQAAAMGVSPPRIWQVCEKARERMLDAMGLVRASRDPLRHQPATDCLRSTPQRVWAETELMRDIEFVWYFGAEAPRTRY